MVASTQAQRQQGFFVSSSGFWGEHIGMMKMTDGKQRGKLGLGGSTGSSA
jgi:hypothetical protein